MVSLISDQWENTTGCIVHYSWIPPRNTNMTNITHFMVTFNGVNKSVDYTGESVYMRAHSVCTCAQHNISIAAVDHCGRMGPSRNHVISREPQSLFIFDSVCNDTVNPVNPPLCTDDCECRNEGENNNNYA